MKDDELRNYFSQDELTKLPLTMKTANKHVSNQLNEEEDLKKSFVKSKFHYTSKYSSHYMYKPVSSLFHEK